MSLDGPLSTEESNGIIDSIDETVGVIRLDAGGCVSFNAGHCYRNGTSFPYIRVGDRVRFDTEYHGVSSPNGRRWKEGR